MTRTIADPRAALERLAAEYGAARVLAAAIAAAFRPARRARPPDAGALGPHLRRDIGLPPEPRAPRHRWMP